uniref:Endonuclease n=1 Tax=Aceria tosichella TaxID=561515 RepID=A0A6G1S8I9_9ACAR
MANNIIKFCTAALAGSLIGVAYERWPHIKADLFTGVSADSSLVPPKIPYDDSFYRPGNKIINVDPKVSAENLVRSSRFGLPSKDNLRVFNDFVLSYDRRLRSPIWVLEHLHPGKLDLQNNVSRKHSKFQEDTAIHEYFRATLKDFKGSHLDRGHMAAAANHKMTQDDMDQTFVLSNISPQDQKLNSGAWERLESYVRWLAKGSKNLYVVSGPLYLPHKARDGNTYVTYRVIGNNMVSVPTHYFKVILTETKDDKLLMEAFLMPNDPKMTNDVKVDDYRVKISDLNIIERASGVIFFDALQRDQVEAPLSLPSSFKPRVYDDNKTRLPQPTPNDMTK